MEKYYVSGCKRLQGVVETCADEQADFWTLYQRDDEGLSAALADFPNRKAAESAMAVYVDRDALQQERDALAAENAALDKAIGAVADAYETGVSDILANEIDIAVNLETPATDAFLNGVRAEVIPEGYVLVPQQMHLSAEAMESLCFHCGDGGFAFGDFTDGILWVGDIENDDGSKTYGLNIATAEYPEEGSANITEFSAQLRAPKGDSDAE